MKIKINLRLRTLHEPYYENKEGQLALCKHIVQMFLPTCPLKIQLTLSNKMFDGARSFKVNNHYDYGNVLYWTYINEVYPDRVILCALYKSISMVMHDKSGTLYFHVKEHNFKD